MKAKVKKAVKKATATASTLPSTIALKVGKTCDVADVAFVEGRFLEAAETYEKAWKLLPEPRERWESGREIVKCVAEACLAAGDVDAARVALAHAEKHKGAEDDEGLSVLVKRISAVVGRSPARAPKKAKATPRRPSRRGTASTRKAKTPARRRRRPSS
jgi:thioredoxin-like negative regulator of GroEL